MGKPFWRSVEYFFTGNYSADDGNNNIVAIGFGGQIHAYGGDDHVTVGSIGATVYTGSGNDTVVGGSAYLKVEDSTGHLTVKGAAGYADINKSGDGNVSFAGAAGGVSIDHLGNHGDVSYGGAAAYNGITRKGLSGNVTFAGAGGYNALWHETNQGNLSFTGAGAGNKLDRTWFNRYQGSHGDVTFDGAGAANSISSRVETGNITFRGAGADNHLVRKGKVGDITLQGAGASNRIERTHQAEDVYTQTRGNIRFEGVGGYNSLYSDVAHGDIHFSGGGAYNTIIRKGSGNDFAKEGMTNAKADEIVLTKAVMSGSWIGQDHHVTAVKSASEPNTYLFAFADSTYTKINKVQLRNDPQTGELKYYSTAWYKEGNRLSNLANQDISDNGGFTAVNINGAYTLSDLKVEHQQSVTVHAVEKSLTEYEWVTYANGAVIDAKEVSLSDAKMGGHAIYADGTKVDVKAVKSNRQPNTYIYAKVLGPYTKIVVVELANDPETGALKYQARSWYKEGDHTANIANQDISSATGYNPMGKGGYSLSDLHYSVNAVRSTSETVADIEEYTDQTLFKPANDSGESSGDVRFNGAGGGNVIKSNVTRGNVHFNGGGIANVILHSSQFGNTEFNGGGAANVIVKSGEEGDLTFRGAGLANVLVHQSQQGKMDVYAGGAVNVLVRLGDGQYLAHLLAYGNISVQKGSGDSRVVMLGGYNTHTQIGSGNGLWLASGGFNVMTQVGKGDVAAVLAGGANVLTKMGEGELTSGMLGGANVITHISNDDQLSNTTAVALGGANILTKKGKGNTLAVMGGGANVLTHVGDGTTTGVMVGGANILTKIGNGDTTGIMLGVGNVLTHVGDGQTLGVMGAAGNIFTKVGDGTSIAVMIGAGNIFTHVGEGNAWALMGGLGNVFTKVGNGDALALMVAEANVFTHIGDGMSEALMLAKGNVATKVGNGTTLAAMVGNANTFTHIGHGSTFAAMIGQANIMTKVGNDLTAALMVGKANIMTHVGDGTSLGLFAGEVNVMTKVGNGTTLAAMFGKANIMTHVGDGLTGVLALGEANIVTKVGDDFMGVVAAAKANVVTHVGDATTAAVLAGKGNILTKVGEGTTVGLLISDVGNVMTHVGDGTTIGIAKGKANLITKVGDGLGVNVAWGQANVFTQVGDGDRYNFAKGEANLITKVGDDQEVSVVQGEANIITHVGNGDDYTGAWGKANVITKVGHGQNVVLAKGEANIVTQVGDGDSFNALWSKGNIVTKVGDGMQVTAAKGKANITTTVGNGLNVTAAYGDANINTKVGDGVSVNVAWGKYNINTKVGDGLNVAVMKGKANANIHVGDGLNINASYAQNNVAIKVGNGDFYSLAVASSNTSSNKLSALFDNIKQTVLGVGGSQAINYLVQGDEASSSGTHKGRGAIATPEITKLDGFQMDAIKEVSSDLGDSLTGSVTKVDTPDLNKMQHALNVDDSSVQAPNLIVNGDFELGEHGWQSTHGVEASYAGSVYGVEGEGHGARVTELDTYTNTSLYQDLANLAQGEVIAVSFDFAKRAGLSNNEGIEVLWNGEVVFSSSGDESAWQQKTLKLTAQAGSNRIEFKGTGHNDGLGYILDNVVATSESSQQANAIREHATQNPAAQNALSDKERAEADRQHLEQEKQKQLDAVAGSQSQLESTDQQALGNNGQAQRDAVQEESEAITAELTKLAQGLDVLDGQATHTGESGDQWRNEFASGLLAGVQTQLDDAKQLANDKIAEAKQTHADNQNKVKDAVAKSEAGVAKGEQNRAGAEQDIADAQADAEKRKADALAKGKDAQQAESDAHHAVNNAQSRGDRDVQLAENKANQAQADAQGAKQNEGDRPDRQGVTGSGLSGNAHSVEGAGETDSHVKTDSQTNADGRFSEGLTEQEQEALEGATNAVNRLQINAGIRAKNSVSSMTSMFSETNSKSIVVPTKVSPEPVRQEVTRRDVRISGVNLESLSAVQGNQPTGQLASKSVPGFKSHFASTSIGIENELSGLVVVLPKNSAQTFGYVHDSQGNPLFMLTKDMNQGGYSNPVGINDIQGVNNWQTHTIELVTYPSEISDTAAVESRKEAMLWLAKEFTDHINQSNHQSLPHLVSDDGRFTLVISNSKHLIAAGNGTSIDAQGKTIGMTSSGQQATMAISAKEFGASSSSEVRLLESAPWYQAGLRDEFLANAKNTTLDDPATAQNVYAYLTSVYSKTADLAKEYGIYINDWDPASEGFSPNAQGLTDPKVKNAWSILPRTKPVRMLELLSAEDSRYVRQQIAEKLKGTYSESLAKNVFEYFQYGGEVAGHGINNATTGSVQQPEPAILFEFRSVPSALSDFVPKTASTVKVDVKALDHFDSASRKAIITEVNALVSGSEDFDAWYQEYRASKGQPPVKNPKSSASANHKAEWLMTQHAEQWAKITAPYTDNHETLTSTKLASNDKEELHALGETSNLDNNKQQENVASIINTMLNDMLPFYALRTERNLLVQEGDEGFEVRAWPGTEDKSKTIILEEPEDAAQHKAIERFILANFDNFEQMPDELFLVDNKVISHHEGRTHVLAQKVDGAWQYNATVELMSVTELLDAANVTGKIRGESYQQVIDALTDYHASITEHADYESESVEKLLNLRKKIEGYVLGHPDSGRVEAMNSLLNQVNTRLDEVSLLSVAEQTIQAQDSFSRLYDQLEAANLKESKHLYLDQNGDFVTKGKGNLANIDLLGSREAVLEKVKLTVSNEYGQTVADTIFAGLSAKDLAKDGKGIDIAGLNKVHQAIEQHLSPVSATLYIWKPSDHSALGHAALQIGQGRTQLEGQAAADFNQQNYVSWWPLGSKSSNISNILNVATKDQPDLKLRWSDFSQPAHQNDTLEHDVASEENDGFGLHDGDIKLKRFIEKLNAAKGIDASFKEASEGYASVLLGNPDMLEMTGIPAHVFQPFVEQWNDTSYDMMDVANRFAQELRLQAQRSDDPELLEKRIGNVVRQFAERALEEIETFKASQADQGRVFRINLEGLDVAAMQAEWHRLRNDPDARYQLLTKNCSSTVAKVLKAGGADKLIGHTWLPKFGVWTPTELFNFAQALQEAQLEIAAKKQSHQVTDVLDALSGNEKPKENVAIENDGTPPRDKESLSPLTRFLNNELYGDKEARRKIGEITQTLLDHAVEKGESQKITLQGEAGRLTGYYHQGTAPREGETSTTSGKVVLFLHGSGSSAEEQASAIRNHYQKQGIDMLAVNLRGYGESDGGPSEKGLYQDARTMFNYLVNDKGIDPSNIIIHGYSMGGPIAADLARYAAQNGQAVSGLLLDRPMPSMTKAITAHEVANPAGIVGAIAKAVNGQFSVEKNLEGLPKETSILLLTDNEGLGNEGEKLRTKLTASGYNVTGEQTFYGHEASNRLMSQYADQIVSGLSSSASVDEDLDQQGLDTTSTKDQGISNKDDHLQVVDSKEALADGKILHNQDVNGWGPITVTPTTDGGETRFDGQIIVQMENDDVVAKAAANLAGKHPESSVVVQLDSDGNYRVVYGDPSKLDGKLRWQLVGHGRDHSESNNTRLSGYSADELAVKLAKFQQSFNQAENINNKPDHISIVGCSLVSDDKQKGFGHQFINAMDANGLRVDVSVRSSELAVDEAGRKHTKDANGDWVQKAENNKVSLSWDAQGEVVAKDERIRNGIAEGDIDLSRIGVSDVDEPARGAIGDNSDVFDAPEKRKPETEVIANSSSSNQLSYSGNIQVNVGEGEFTAVNWGTSNVGIKVGTGGFKSLAFGDNNVMVHIGDGESKHSVDVGGYQALEGAQMFLGNRNVSFNFGHSNDLILMMDKSIPTPPLVNPFDGAARISGVLQGIATSGEGEDWLAAQEQQWTLSGAKKFVKDMSGLDQSSSVDYTTLVELDSQNERDSRGLKHDAEATLNKQYNQWLSGNGNSGTSQLSRADKLRQANEKLAFNFAVGGQGADIQVTTGNWNFMFGDNIQSILDTNLGSLFGLMTQQFTATGQAKTTFTYTPQDLPRQLKNKLLGQLAGVGAETTLADIFGVDYTASGQIVSRNGQAVDGVVILKEMLEVIGEFSGDQLQAFVDPAKLLDSLKAGIDMGADGIKSFAETHGLKEKAPEEEKDNSSVSVNGANVNSAQGATMADGNTETAETQDRALGFNSLNLPNLFATIFSQDKQKEMKSLVENLKQNLTADLLNMKEKTFDFLRNSGHLQGDGDINISLGNYNFNWGGDGKDLGAYLGDNNNFWGGRGDDVFYATGTSNIFTGGEGHDMGVLMGRENMMFGGDGNDTAVVAGRINHVFLGAGDDQSFVFGEGGEIDTGSGRDYVVTSGNFNRVDTGDDQDYSVTIGNNNQVELGAGNDFANVFGNYNRINAGAGNDVVKLMGYHAVLNGGDGDDHLIAAAISKFSQFNGGEGRDLMVLGGYQNTFKGGTDVDSFVVSGDVIDNLVEDIRSEDNIVFNGIDWQKLWFERSGYDLKLSILRDPSNDSDQSKFEHIGSVTFSDYFNGNRAQVVIGMSDKDLSGEREYTMLSDSAIDALVQAMSGFEPQAGDNGFIDSLESKSQAAISMVWSDVVHKKGLMV
ncbi:MARTX multifunctional-autoprocessing repeats-in-toxin holotoxin RtxA [Vibrio cholerae]|uniref:MARTX multifunctional-autoprocessing repeats-in-toxin holotoxin RtxA n=1 Tax=Vibrio cholerae TaxID=666 RepID=UPI0028DFDED4|nr:MARTX multifunctional-autoprocessing repeats-in-toxin holotoxin RtxA [Vibrio cholerae]EJK2191826.1 MARTX multifunctional-autoprocessing repeats-in-toxin holotoxin RtxA [Vibrio cholerae]EKF9461470.1 MARTX multifunctional-autoprocessing repeats-in-toxin holotoxin RtxA [Vibrio cholerae]EKS2824750.1 MARTX multifunctional-autoprocessing repeats-in-toxin holotoxin RtxA [Vibrio cholerae]ELN6872561.1 MARTX multifunctional-autoprocessing repeats-in-toxin holotoxin RtxA [Vibrio cholerae]ELS8903903.1 